MRNFDISFQYPLRLLFFIPALVLILVPLFRITKKRRTVKKTVPAVMNAVLALLLILAIAGMQFSSITSRQAVVILVDQSASVTSADVEAVETAQQLYDRMHGETDVAAVLFG